VERVRVDKVAVMEWVAKKRRRRRRRWKLIKCAGLRHQDMKIDGQYGQGM
jgi:hypothetical protein